VSVLITDGAECLSLQAHQSSGDLIADRRFAYGMALLEESDFEGAIDLFQQTLELTKAWPVAWFALAEAFEKSDQSVKAIGAFETCLALSPGDNLGAGVRLSRLGSPPQQTAMSPAYVSALFDQYAARFDEHLTKALDYRGPEILKAALEAACLAQVRRFHFSTVFDLGCGTGLMAKAIADHLDVIDGVDLSPAMVTFARKTGLYRDLFEGDLVSALHDKQHSFGLILAADVFVYMSDLRPVFIATNKALEKGGLFAFTVQSCTDGHFKLGTDLRYHHSENYILETAAAAGLEVVSLKPCVTRHDAGKPTAGMVAVLCQTDTSRG
jgi:predicted TPR repeat methyltransferase